MVVSDAAGEGVQVGLVIGFDGGEPGVETVAVQAGEDLGELGDVGGEGVQVRAPVPDLGERGFLGVIEVLGVGEDPAGDVAGFRRRRHGGRGGARSRNGCT